MMDFTSEQEREEYGERAKAKLCEAADWLDAHEWLHGRFFRRRLDTGEVYAACLVGALQIVCGDGDDPGFGDRVFDDPTYRVARGLFTEWVRRQEVPEDAIYFESMPDGRRWIDPIDWNDDKGRTADEAKAALREVGECES